MKKLLVLALVGGLMASALVSPAGAAKPKPVKTTLYMHGNNPVGESEFVTFVANSTIMTMDANAPATGAPKSQSYFFSGNEDCAGNPLFPSWDGKMAGTIVGDLKLYANTLAAPSQATVRIWVDIPYSSCTSSTAGTDAFQPPVAEQVIDIPEGLNEVEVVFEKLKLPVAANIVVEIHQSSPANQGRVLYDSAEFPTRIEFDCIPPKGAKTCA